MSADVFVREFDPAVTLQVGRAALWGTKLEHLVGLIYVRAGEIPGEPVEDGDARAREATTKTDRKVLLRVVGRSGLFPQVDLWAQEAAGHLANRDKLIHGAWVIGAPHKTPGYVPVLGVRHYRTGTELMDPVTLLDTITEMVDDLKDCWVRGAFASKASGVIRDEPET
jgi:hypothetical protein